MMKIVSISNELLDKFKDDKEILQKTGQPCVLVTQLKYKGKNRGAPDKGLLRFIMAQKDALHDKQRNAADHEEHFSLKSRRLRVQTTA